MNFVTPCISEDGVLKVVTVYGNIMTIWRLWFVVRYSAAYNLTNEGLQVSKSRLCEELGRKCLVNQSIKTSSETKFHGDRDNIGLRFRCFFSRAKFPFVFFWY